MKATIIDDSLEPKLEPELSKMSTVYVIIARMPENCLRNIRKIPITNPLLADFVTGRKAKILSNYCKLNLQFLQKSRSFNSSSFLIFEADFISSNSAITLA